MKAIVVLAFFVLLQPTILMADFPPVFYLKSKMQVNGENIDGWVQIYSEDLMPYSNHLSKTGLPKKEVVLEILQRSKEVVLVDYATEITFNLDGMDYILGYASTQNSRKFEGNNIEDITIFKLVKVRFDQGYVISSNLSKDEFWTKNEFASEHDLFSWEYGIYCNSLVFDLGLDDSVKDLVNHLNLKQKEFSKISSDLNHFEKQAIYKDWHEIFKQLANSKSAIVVSPLCDG